MALSNVVYSADRLRVDFMRPEYTLNPRKVSQIVAPYDLRPPVYHTNTDNGGAAWRLDYT